MAADALITDAAKNPAPRTAPAASLLSLMSFSPKVVRALPAWKQASPAAVPDIRKNMQTPWNRPPRSRLMQRLRHDQLPEGPGAVPRARRGQIFERSALRQFAAIERSIG